MKQLLQNYKTGELKIAEVPAPALNPGGILVKNHYSLVSATLWSWNGQWKTQRQIPDLRPCKKDATISKKIGGV